MTDAPYDLALTVRALAPARGGRVVASDVSFSLPPGGGLVLRGANGSGKTSVLRAVAGLCVHEGEVSFALEGAPLEAGAAQAQHTHLLAGGGGLVPKLTAGEHARFWGGLYGAADEDALDRVGLAGAERRPAGALSTGQRRRLGLARLLMAPRPLWLLDEPMSGLDEEGRALLLAAIHDHRAAGGLVLMATHEGDGLPGAPVLRLG